MKDIRERTYQFGLEIIRLIKGLKASDMVAREIGIQLLRSGTSISANLEEAYAALTKADFVHSTNISRKEAREAKNWLRFLVDSNTLDNHQVISVLTENEEIIRILTSIVKKSQDRKV
ncbi:MAG: four helix bundle protein [Elusimicrobia bacterium]|nr:four helix bundle protein [Elusimicrobiota bacterium]